MASGSSD